MRVGIVGAGQVAARHAAAYAAHPETTLVAVVEPVRARGEALADTHAAGWWASIDDLFADSEVDAVSVCVPHDLHREICAAAYAVGAHVLLEKPIANTLEDADAIVAAAQEAGVVLMLGFVHRFRSEALEAKRLVDEGAIGVPATALDRFSSLGGHHPPSWVWERGRAGGGVLMYGGIHAIDRLRWLLHQEIVSVTARAHRTYGFGDVEDGLVALLDFSGDASGALFENSPPFGRPGGWSTEVFGSEGAIRIQTGEWLELTTKAGTVRFDAADELHFEREIGEFVAAVTEGRPPSVTGDAGRAALVAALAAYQSAETGATVQIGSC